MSKKLIRLTEQDIHRIVKESVMKIISEGYWDDYYERDTDTPDGEIIKDYMPQKPEKKMSSRIRRRNYIAKRNTDNWE